MAAPKMILFDEPSSALDNESEEGLIQLFSELRQFTTLIVVAHKLKTIKDANVLIRITNGRIQIKRTPNH
jgi:ABC-type bacteriocin/lantibiotic exporter with double-glycine peptidase domain